MIVTPGRTTITDLRSAGSPRDLPGCAIAAHIDAPTIFIAIRDPGQTVHLPRGTPDRPASGAACRPDQLERDRPTVKRP